MSATLAEAVRALNLRPGETYRATVDDHDVEVRKRADAPGPPIEADPPSPELAGQMMLPGLVVVPFRPAGMVTATRRTVQLPAPFTLDESDLAPE